MHGDVKQVTHGGVTFMVYVQFAGNDGHAQLMRHMAAYQTSVPSVDASCMYHHAADLPL